MPNEFAGRLELLTIHGGSSTVTAAKQGRGDNDKPCLLMLTVLSSMDAADLKEFAPDGAVPDTDAIVIRRARQALDAGCEGLIASGSSVRALRRELCDREFLIVAPGIRPADTGQDDHKRTLTPRQAIADGADYLVVGRPITQSPNPLQSRAIHHCRYIEIQVNNVIPAQGRIQCQRVTNRMRRLASFRAGGNPVQ